MGLRSIACGCDLRWLCSRQRQARRHFHTDEIVRTSASDCARDGARGGQWRAGEGRGEMFLRLAHIGIL